MPATLQKLNNEIAGLVKKVARSLAVVRDGKQGGAAGIIWHSDGLIVTNAHIISRERAKVMLADGRTFDAELVARDVDKDLAALSIDADGLAALPLGDSESLMPGQFVIAMGHPRGINNVATAGIVMGEGARHLKVSNAQSLLAVNLSLRPGNSGGPLVDTEGRLVGINTIMTGPDTGLAIPVDTAKAFLRGNTGSPVS